MKIVCYIDPGTGAFVLQIFAAIGLGALFYSKKFFGMIRGVFSFRRKVKKKDSPNEKQSK